MLAPHWSGEMKNVLTTFVYRILISKESILDAGTTFEWRNKKSVQIYTKSRITNDLTDMCVNIYS
jgi:hypothetical protein